MSDSHAKWLREAAKQIAKAGHNGWGNTCEDAAEHIDVLVGRLRTHAEAHEYIANADPEQKQWMNDLYDAAASIEALVADLTALRAERGKLLGCRDELREIAQAIDDPRLHNTMTITECVKALQADLTAERALREKAEAEAAGYKADAERWRAVSAMMTHEHRADAVGWTLSVLLPGDDPDAAIDAARAGGE